MKENQENLLESAEVLKRRNNPTFAKQNTKGEYGKVWESKDVYWATADKDVRVIWAGRRVPDYVGKGKQKKLKLVDKKNIFVFSKEMDAIPTRIVYQISRQRWKIAIPRV